MKTRVSKSLVIWSILITLSLALVGLALAGCDSSSANAASNDEATNATTADDSNAPEMGTAIFVTEADNGKSYTLAVGDTITVTLEGNPTTGYTWESAMPEVDSPLLVMLGTEPVYTPTETGSEVVGAGGTFTFTFQAMAAGQVELKLKYWRPFESQAEPLETFSVNVTIE